MGLRTEIAAVLTLVAVLLAGCGESIDPNEPQGFIQTKGSDTIVNAIQQTAEEFMKDYPHVFVAVTGGGSGVGIASLINKTTDIATASREMKAKEIEMAEKRGVYPKEFVCPQIVEGLAAPTLRDGAPADAGMKDDAVETIDSACEAWVKEVGVGFSLCVARHGVIVLNHAYGTHGVGPDKDKAFTPETRGPLAPAL